MSEFGTSMTILPIDIPGQGRKYRVIIARTEWSGGRCTKSEVDLDTFMKDETFVHPGLRLWASMMIEKAGSVLREAYFGGPYPPASSANPYPPVASDTPTQKL